GGRTSLAAALVAALTSLVIGLVYGGLAGYAGGRVDEVLMRAVDALQSIPFIFFVIFVGTLLAGWRTELEDSFGLDREALFFLVIGAVWWLSLARIVRGQVRALRDGELVAALRVLGASHARILFAHLLPAVLPLAIVYLALTVPSVMLFEAFLSFLGLGIEAPQMSWGSLAADGVEALNPVRFAWWLALFPALAMASVLLALNLFGDALRDALDPRGTEERA
ncbi:MAG: ABC transporter permease, partial [Planctomycetota bacterium]